MNDQSTNDTEKKASQPSPQQSLSRSFHNAFEGVVYAVRTQRNARIHVAVAIAVVALGVFVQLTRIEWSLIAITIASVFAAEIVNNAIEALVDLVSPDYHPLAKAAKDAGAGAVLCLAVASVVVGLLVLGPPLLKRLFH